MQTLILIFLRRNINSLRSFQSIIFLIVFFVYGCSSNTLDFNNIQEADNGLSYVKGTSTLAHGKAYEKIDGKLVTFHTYKNGKMVGPWEAYGMDGEISSHGFGVELNANELGTRDKSIDGSTLSVILQDGFNYSSLRIYDTTLFKSKASLLELADAVFKKYGEKYNFTDLVIFNKQKEVAFDKKKFNLNSANFDTASLSPILKINVD